jgi:hypothetical protein
MSIRLIASTAIMTLAFCAAAVVAPVIFFSLDVSAQERLQNNPSVDGFDALNSAPTASTTTYRDLNSLWWVLPVVGAGLLAAFLLRPRVDQAQSTQRKDVYVYPGDLALGGIKGGSVSKQRPNYSVDDLRKDELREYERRLREVYDEDDNAPPADIHKGGH